MISIIVPIYNAELYLYECLDSIRNQTYKDFEVICVDDGSTDKSRVICESFTNDDKRFVIITKVNGGVSSARNLALDKAQGDYICFVDSDDIIAPDFLEHLLEISKGGDFAICNYTREFEGLGSGQKNTKMYDSVDYINHVINETVQHPNICMMLFKSRIIKDLDLSFTLGCVRNEDYEFYMKYMSQEKQVTVSDYKAYYYRDNLLSASHKYDKRSLTAIDADERTGEFLKNKGIRQAYLILPAGVQLFVFRSARQRNMELYNLIHEKYNVRLMMQDMAKHPRLSRKGVAWIYCILGRKLFYSLISLF